MDGGGWNGNAGDGMKIQNNWKNVYIRNQQCRENQQRVHYIIQRMIGHWGDRESAPETNGTGHWSLCGVKHLCEKQKTNLNGKQVYNRKWKSKIKITICGDTPSMNPPPTVDTSWVWNRNVTSWQSLSQWMQLIHSEPLTELSGAMKSEGKLEDTLRHLNSHLLPRNVNYVPRKWQ